VNYPVSSEKSTPTRKRLWNKCLHVCHSCGHFKYMKKTINNIVYNDNFEFQHSTEHDCPFPPAPQERPIYNGWHDDCTICIDAATTLGYDKPSQLIAIKKYLRKKFYSPTENNMST
jgi:hypothetical protein